MGELQHNVALKAGGKLIERWSNYSIDLDMLTPADQFRAEFGGFTKEIYDLCKPDNEVEVYLDGTRLITGFIDDRIPRGGRGQAVLDISGRDKAGRLTDESMPLGAIEGTKIKSFVEQCIRPWFTSVTFSNVQNSRNLRGQGDKLAKVSKASSRDRLDNDDKKKTRAAIAGGDTKTKLQGYALLQSFGELSKAEKADLIRLEASLTDPYLKEWAHSIVTAPASRGTASAKKVPPGERRWDALESFLRETGLLAWSTADGEAFFIGGPNYEQEPQYRFVAPGPGSDRMREGNVLEWEVKESVAERFSHITVFGQGKGNKENSHTSLSNRADIFDGPHPDGTGKDFVHRKQMILVDNDARSPGLAQERAANEMGFRDSQGFEITLTVAGHSQSRDGGQSYSLYAFDTLAEVEIEEIGLKEVCLLTAVSFQQDRINETTRIRMVRKGARLKP